MENNQQEQQQTETTGVDPAGEARLDHARQARADRFNAGEEVDLVSVNEFLLHSANQTRKSAKRQLDDVRFHTK